MIGPETIRSQPPSLLVKHAKQVRAPLPLPVAWPLQRLLVGIRVLNFDSEFLEVVSVNTTSDVAGLRKTLATDRGSKTIPPIPVLFMYAWGWKCLFGTTLAAVGVR